MRCLLLLLAFLVPAAAPAKDLRTKEQRLYAVKLRAAQWEVDRKELELQIRQGEYAEMRDLYAEHISTSDQLNLALGAQQQAQLAYDQAVLALEETRLSFLRGATHIAVRQARKFRTGADRYEVEITLENTSQLGQAMALNPQQRPEELESLLALQDIVVSLRSAAGLIIAEPYQQLVPQLALGQQQTLKFALLEDCQALVVSMQLPDGHAEAPHIALRREAVQDLPLITTPETSREGELNTKVSYQLILERLAEDDGVFLLATEGLPDGVGAVFLDPATEAEVKQVHFGPETTHQQLTLELQLPESLPAPMLDQPLSFSVLALRPAAYQELVQARRHRGAGGPLGAEMGRAKTSYAVLTLVPHGTGEVEVWAETRAQRLAPGETARFNLQVANTGSLDLEQVALTTSLPAGWSALLDPAAMSRLPAGERQHLVLSLQAPAGLQGEYEFRLTAAAQSGRRHFTSPEKVLSLRVEAPADWRRGLVLAGAVLALLGAAIALSIHLRRR